MNRATLKITLNQLERLLGMPATAHIRTIIRSKTDPNTYIFFLQGEGMPEVDPDKITPEAKLVWNGKED